MKRVISIVLSLLILVAMIPLSGFASVRANATIIDNGSNSAIDVGDCITLGTYNGEPIVWRCVDIDEYGPLMLSEKILCNKAYDANGENSEYHSDGWGYIRKKYGSNCWSDSSIRQWLNTDGYVDYTHCPPEYQDELGFLSNFSSSELALVKTVTQKSYLNEWETHRTGYVDGGTREPSHINDIAKLNDDTSSYWYQNVTDKFFLLERNQLYNIYENNPAYLYAEETYFTRYVGNSGASYENIFGVGTTGNFTYCSKPCSALGIRPAFYLNVDNYGEEPQMSDQDRYLKQHIDFVNSVTFNTASNDFRYATTLWTNYHGSTSQAVGEFVYDIQEGFFETISFQGMSSLENPYDAIILDILSSKSVKASLSDAVDSSAISVIDSVIGDLITTFQADSDWADDIDIADNFKDLLDLEATDYSSNKLYQSLDKLFDGKSTDQINSIFSKYDCYSNVLANISDAAKGVDYFLEILKYTASIEAYYNASEEFKAILKEVADVMPSVNADYGQKFNETYNNYNSCIDYNSVMQNVLNHAAEEGFWLLTDLMSDVLQDSALTFCKTALKMSESAAGTLVASLWAAETGFNLGNMITENDTLINCRRLLRANYMLDEAVHHVMCSHASALKANPSYDEALYFDAAFNLFKNLQISSLELHQKYMKTNGSSFINFLAGKQDFFKREAEAQAVIIDTWKNIKCHDDNLIDSITYSKSNTVVVACPTNVYVYRKSDGELVASVINNEVYNTDYALTVITESNEKAICLPNLNDYKIKIEATDDGNMAVDYTVSTLERTHYDRAIFFNNVELSNQSTFDFQVDSENNNISLIDQNQNLILPDLDTSDLVFKSTSLILQNDLAVNYKVEKTLFEDVGYTDPYVVFELNGVKTKVSNYTVSGDRYIFTFRNIAPNQMNDTIKSTLYATYNGVEYAGTTREYSVAEYCYSMLDLYATDEYAELRTLLVDLLHYGAASQTYTSYRTDALVNASLTDSQLLWGTSAEPALDTVLDTTYKTVENPAAKWKGAGLHLQEAVAMRLKFTAENIAGLTVKIESGESTWTISSDKFLEEDGVYYVYFTGLDAGQMRQSVYLTIYDGDTPVSNTVCYSIGSYAYEKQNSTIAGLPELVKAMMKYGDSAYAYVH